MGFARSSCVPQYFHADIMIKRRKFGSALLVGDKILIDFLIDFFVLTERLQHNIAERFLISHFILLPPLYGAPLYRDVEREGRLVNYSCDKYAYRRRKSFGLNYV